VTVKSDHIRAAVIDRAALDVHLAQRAEAAGAEIRLGCRADRIDVGASSVRVSVRGECADIEARACVLACGASYRFHKTLGLGVPSEFLQSAQLETPFPAVQDVEVRFGRDVAPAGFAWLVPLTRHGQSYARIGLMTETRSRERFASVLAALCQRAGVDPSSIAAPKLKMLPLGPVKKTYGERVLAVGDAAGLVKPTTGGGIYYGMLSGQLAAEVLGKALCENTLSASALGRYESRWRGLLGQEIRVGLAFRRIAARLSDESIDAIIELARVNGVVPLLQEKASFNWHRKAAMALLAHPAFRKIVFKSWRTSAGLI